MKQMQKGWVIITGIEALYGILQLFGMAFSNHAFFQTTGDFLNPGPFAGYLAIGLPVVLKQVLDSSFSQNEDRKYWGFVSYISLMLVILILPATMSRAAWLAVSAGCLCTCVMHKRFMEEVRQSLQKYFKFKKIIYLGLGGVAVVLIAGLIATYQIKKDSADGRFIVWQVSAEIFKEYPLTGAGLGKFPVAYGEAQSAWFSSEERPEEAKMLADVPEYAFNEYVQVLSEWGLIGLILFLSIMIFAVRPLWSSRFRTRRSAASGFTGSLIAFSVFSCFSYPLRLFPLTMIWVLLLALSASFQEEHRNSPVNAWTPRIFSLVCLILCLMMFPAQFPRQKAFKAWKSASFLYQGNIYREAAEEYAPLLKELGDQKDYLFEYGQSLSKSNQPEAGNRIFTQGLKFSSDPMFYNCMGNNYKAMGMYEQAEQAYLKAENIVPNRHYPLYLLAKLYFETGNTLKAKETAEELLNKPVKIQTTAIEEMQNEIKTLLSTLP
jgi:O-antigen ligase